VRLLTDQNAIATRTTVEDLSGFCLEVERIANQIFDKSKQTFKVLVQFDCTPAGHQIQIAHQGDASQELLQTFYDELSAMNKLSVSRDEVSFQVEIDVRE
jgi:hypothetical protein